jgi:DNA-binding NarL/FixJ family response regulator
MNVLIVDDAPIIILKISELLDEANIISNISSCNSYAEAIHILPSAKPDVVILDIHLRDKSGMDLLPFIKTNYPKVLVIMCTNQEGEYYRNQCRKLGADYFVDKSKDFDIIPELIASLR